MSLDSFTQLPYTYACCCSSLRALENTQLLHFAALKDYYKQNGHTGDEGQKVPRQQDQQYEDLRALLFQQGVKHSPASSPCLTLHPVPAVPAAPPQRRAALWQKGRNPEHPHTCSKLHKPVSQPRRKQVQDQAGDLLPRCWARDVPIAGTANPRQDLRARGSASTPNFQHLCLSHS